MPKPKDPDRGSLPVAVLHVLAHGDLPSSAFRARAGSRRSNSNTIAADRRSWPSCAGSGSSTVPRFLKPPGDACPGSSEWSRRPRTRRRPPPTTRRKESDEAPAVADR